MAKKTNSILTETIWSNSVSAGVIVVAGSDNIPPADVNFSGIVPAEISHTKDGKDITGIIAEMAGVDCEGINPAAVTGSTCTIVLDPASVEYEALGNPGYIIPSVPAESDHEGIVVPVSKYITSVPAEVDMSGILPAAVTAYAAIIVNIPADASFSNAAAVPLSISVVPASEIFTTAVPADVDFENPVAGLVNIIIPVVPANADYSGIPARLFFDVPETASFKPVYKCVLTGAPDGETDLTLPIKSLSIRLRDGTPTYCGVIIPNVSDYEDDVIDRQNGEIVVSRGYLFTDGTLTLSEICRVDFETIAYSKGPYRESMTLSGHSTESSETPETIDIQPLQSLSLQSDGRYRARAKTSNFLRPGDTVIYNSDGDTFTAGLISISVGNKLDKMEVTEAA